MDHQANTGWLQVVMAWAGVVLSKLGIHGWSDAAAITTTVLTLMLIVDHIRKKAKARRERL